MSALYLVVGLLGIGVSCAYGVFGLIFGDGHYRRTLIFWAVGVVVFGWIFALGLERI